MTRRRRSKKAIGEGGAAIAAAGLSVAASPSPLVAAAGVAGAANAVYAAFQAWQDERVRRLLQEAYSETAADEGFAPYIAALLRKPRVRRVFLESVRAALESVTDEVLPALGALMREYERTEREPDASFRGLCRILQEMSAGEYASARAMFRAAASARAFPMWREVAFLLSVSAEDQAKNVCAMGTFHAGGVEGVPVGECNPDHFPRVSYLLYVHGLGAKHGPSAAFLDRRDVLDEVRMNAVDVRWVAAFLAK